MGLPIMSKTTSKKVAHLENVVIGAGFLLQRCMNSYRNDFSEGMFQQMRDCIQHCNQISRNVAEREAKKDITK